MHISYQAFGLIAYDQICQKAQPLITSKKVICLYYQEMTFKQAKAYSHITDLGFYPDNILTQDDRKHGNFNTLDSGTLHIPGKYI